MFLYIGFEIKILTSLHNGFEWNGVVHSILSFRMKEPLQQANIHRFSVIYNTNQYIGLNKISSLY